MEAQELEWFQKADKLFITLNESVAQQLIFPVHKKLINYLAASVPPFVFLKVIMNNNAEHDFLLNFTGLKPQMKAQKKLKITIGAEQDDETKYQNIADGRYYFYRGDSYSDKFLTDTGWATSKKAFFLIDKDKLSKAYQVNAPEKKQAEPEMKFPTGNTVSAPTPPKQDNTILEITI